MAKRSDTAGVLPNHLKKMLTLGVVHGHIDSDVARSIRKAFISAHAAQEKFRLKKTSHQKEEVEPDTDV